MKKPLASSIPPNLSTGTSTDGGKASKESRKLKRVTAPPPPSIKVSAFVDLMRRLESFSANLSNEQVRFVQMSIHRFENDQLGIVKTKLVIPKPKKEKSRNSRSTVSEMLPADINSDAFLERLTHAKTEDEVYRAIEALPDDTAMKYAASQGLRSSSPVQARTKLMDNIITLRQMSRIQNAGKADKEQN